MKACIKILAKLCLIGLCLLMVPQIIKAQPLVEKVYNEQWQFWTSINGTTRLTDRWGIMSDVHLRRTNFIKDPNFYFLRLGAIYWYNDELSFSGGVAALWLATNTEVGTKFAQERRTFQQVLWRSKIAKAVFLHRIRVEQRWHEVLAPSNGTVDRIRFSNRFRYLISVKLDIVKNPKLPDPVIANEIHYHIGKEIVYNTFDQNRVFLGVNQSISNSWSVDYGYMLVLQQRYVGNIYDLNHTFRLFFYYTPDFRKKKSKDLPHYPISGTE